MAAASEPGPGGPRPGTRNGLTDVAGIRVGNATDEVAATGVTVVLCEDAVATAVDVRGGGPGTRETDVLAPENLVGRAHAIVLSGGSVFGLAAADAVAASLSARGVGLRLPSHGIAIPIVPCAVLHDLGNDGDKAWRDTPPYFALGRAALAAADGQFALGPHGAGRGARAGNRAGGLGSASLDLGDGLCVAALVAVNPAGSVMRPDGVSFHAGDEEIGDEFGNLPHDPTIRSSDPFPPHSRLHEPGTGLAGRSTTIAVVAVGAALTTVECRRVAMMAQDGIARAVRPAHTPVDGDTVFCTALPGATLPEPGTPERTRTVAWIGAAAAGCLARAIARGVWLAGGHRPDPPRR